MSLVSRSALAAAAIGPLLAGCASAPRAETAPAPAAAPATSPATASTGTASTGTASSGAATGLPLKLAPRPTTPALTAADLMTRLYVYADDSLGGREAGTPGHQRATELIAAEAGRIGLQPAGENGGFFQVVPMVQRLVPTDASLSVEGQALARGSDWIPVPPLAAVLPFGGPFTGSAQAIFAGRAGDVASYPSAEQVKGKVVVLLPPLGPNGQPNFQFWGPGQLARFRGAAAVAVASLEITPPQFREFFTQPVTMLRGPALEAGTPFGLMVSARVASLLMGGDLAALKPGATGRTVQGNLRLVDQPTAAPTRNVIAVIPGSDPALRGQYVAIGAHSDHVGVDEHPVDHDSLRAYNAVVRPSGADSPPRPGTAEETARIRAMTDSLHALHPPRADSIFNGADDDGSGSMALLEIAQSIMAMPTKPKRSILLVWHTAEEKGLFGSEFFTEHPTVPRDSIVAQVNVDMIGRGGAHDVPNGGQRYLQVLGSRRLSTQVGDLVEQVNGNAAHNFAFDYQYDADGHPQNLYCRSDHWSYARFGIPVVFFSTGLHRDYHQLTDEPQYIDYEHFARVARFIQDVATHAADLPQRPVVDKPKPDPYGQCRQ